MCGIAGFFTRSIPLSPEQWPVVLRRMGDVMSHRGPDDAGIWMDQEAGIGLSHRRLSILDLSPAGHQPMLSASGRYVLVFNGEIYNHEDLRSELHLPRVNWRGHSDTETLLEGFDTWGVENTLKRAVGMFALAFWDREERILTLARDRMGEKPLYYGWQGKAFLFGSELKAFKSHPEFLGEIDRDSITLLLRYNYIPAPYSVYRGIRKLLPGTYMQLNPCTSNKRDLPEPIPFWSLKKIAEAGQRSLFEGDEETTIQMLDDLLRDAINRQMAADVPLGAFLSGGVDSTTVVALMQAQASRSVKTYTIGFNEPGYNEAENAKAVAQYLGTDHVELYITPKEALDVIPRLPQIYDEPFSDSSQIPTFLLSQLTRQYVTVSLSGDAGDELFGGYPRYGMATSIWKSIGWVPNIVRCGLVRCIEAVDPNFLNALLGVNNRLVPPRLRVPHPGDKLHKGAEILRHKTRQGLYVDLVSHWKRPCHIVLDAVEPITALSDLTSWTKLSSFEHDMMYADSGTYLPDDILVKVDRAAMAVSLETRVPLLDHRIVEFAWRLPLSLKIRDGQTKWILRQVLYRYVPKALIERPKMGFRVPIGSWLRGPLREWAESLLDKGRLEREGFFRPAPIRQKWSEHISSKRNWQYYLWDILMFQQWFEHAHTTT